MGAGQDGGGEEVSPFVWKIDLYWSANKFLSLGWVTNRNTNVQGYMTIVGRLKYSRKDPWL